MTNEKYEVNPHNDKTIRYIMKQIENVLIL